MRTKHLPLSIGGVWTSFKKDILTAEVAETGDRMFDVTPKIKIIVRVPSTTFCGHITNILSNCFSQPCIRETLPSRSILFREGSASVMILLVTCAQVEAISALADKHHLPPHILADNISFLKICCQILLTLGFRSPILGIQFHSSFVLLVGVNTVYCGH